ncbi:MAG: GNAT family N-acetyltransferase [Candidatus Latescibacterota bacterium]|jgi:GNAT superfamily N-acetyltransferase
MTASSETTLVQGIELPAESVIPAEDPRWLERLAQRAWPALEERFHDGWVLRFSRGFTRRANSVIPLAPGRLPVRAKIGYCLEEYQRRGLPPTFKIIPCSEPEGLDQTLAESGYRLEAETVTQVCPLAEVPVPEGIPFQGRFETWSDPAEAWLEAYLACSGTAASDLPVLQEILWQIPAETRFVVLKVAGGPVACALGVLDHACLGIFSVATAPGYRRRGYARSVIGHLVTWSLAQGAHTAHLQVLAGNEPARRLYASLGLRDAYRYWYRVLGR